MSEEKQVKFSVRALVSVLTTVSFAVLLFSGCILFMTPPGRVANWTGWRILGLTKENWGAVHIVFSALFLIAAALHIYYNWRPLLTYFKSRVSKRFSFRLEWILPIVLCLVAWFGALNEFPPFSNLLDLNDRLKNSWEQQEKAPQAHAELLTIGELAKEAGQPVEELLARLKEQGIGEATAESVAGDLAKAHDLTPSRLYTIATGKALAEGRQGQGGGQGKGGQREGSQGDGGQGKGAQGEGWRGGQGKGAGGGRGETGAASAAPASATKAEEHGAGGGRGYGRMTLADVCADKGLELDATMASLRADGFDPAPDMTLRDLAAQKGIEPFDLPMMKNE